MSVTTAPRSKKTAPWILHEDFHNLNGWMRWCFKIPPHAQSANSGHWLACRPKFSEYQLKTLSQCHYPLVVLPRPALILGVHWLSFLVQLLCVLLIMNVLCSFIALLFLVSFHGGTASPSSSLGARAFLYRNYYDFDLCHLPSGFVRFNIHRCRYHNWHSDHRNMGCGDSLMAYTSQAGRYQPGTLDRASFPILPDYTSSFLVEGPFRMFGKD